MRRTLYSLIFQIPSKPPARFDFLPAPSSISEDRRTLNRSIPLPHGAVYRGVNGEGFASIQLEGHFGVAARQRNGRTLTGEDMFALLSDYISDYWTATQSRNYKLATKSKVEFHDWGSERHLYVEIQSFNAQRGPQNRVTPRRYTLQLEGYSPIRDEQQIASLWPAGVQVAQQSYHWAKGVVDKLEAAGRTMRELSDKAKTLIKQYILRPLKALTGALEGFTSGLTSLIAFPFQAFNSVAIACSDAIIAMGTILSAPATELFRQLRDIRRTVNRLRQFPDLFNAPFDQMAREWSLFQFEPVLAGDSDATREAKINGLNLARKRIAIHSSALVGTGVRQVSVSADDTLQRIAARELGDASRWAEIAILNDLDGNESLVSVTSLLIPDDSTASPLGSALNDTRYQTDEEKLYGRDLRLVVTPSGKLSVVFGSNNDLGVIAGLNNLAQAVTLRQRINQGELLEDPLYGLRAVIGSSQGAQGADELAWSLRYSAETDPRVERVDVEVSVSGNQTTFFNTVYPVGLSGNRPVQSVVRV